jgi:hypothetical protein
MSLWYKHGVKASNELCNVLELCNVSCITGVHESNVLQWSGFRCRPQSTWPGYPQKCWQLAHDAYGVRAYTQFSTADQQDNGACEV